MRRNRRIKKHARFTSGATGIAALIVSCIIMLMIYLSLDARCTSIQREIGKAEREVKALDAEYGRETARWSALMTPESLNEKIARFCLCMDKPQPDQAIRMMASGRPAPGQMAVARAQAKTRIGNMALAAPRRRGFVRR